MTQLLRKAFAEAQKLPEPEQDALANWLLEELESERRWEEAFSRSTTPWIAWRTKHSQSIARAKASTSTA